MTSCINAAEGLKRNGFASRVFRSGEEAAAYLNKVIDGTTVGIGGSMTVKELRLYDSLSKHNEVYWHWVNGKEEVAKAAEAKIYIASANGVSETGEIVNIDGRGNRTAAILCGHEKVYLVVGRNKIAPTFDEAVWRARNIAAPKNAQRIGSRTPCAVKGDRCYDCKSPDRICRSMVVLWRPMLGAEVEILLVDEELGY